MTNLARNARAIVLGEVGSRLLGFVAVAYLARVLQPENFGLISIAFATLGYLVLLASSGIPLHAVRLIAQDREDAGEVVGDVLGLRLFLALTGVLALVLISFLALRDGVLFFLLLFYGLSVIPIAINLEWFFQGRETMQPLGWNRVIGNLGYAISLFFFVRSSEDLLFAPVALFIGNMAAALLIAMWYFRQVGSFHFRWNPASLFQRAGRWRDIVWRSLPIGVGTICTQVSYNLPPILLGIISSVKAAGFFSAASRLVFFLMVFDRLVTSLLFPAIIRYKKFQSDQLTPMLALVQKVVLIVAIPLCVGGTVVAGDIVHLVYGSGFLDSAPVFQVLIWYFFFSVAGSVYAFGLLGIDEEKIFGRRVVQGTLVQSAATVLGTIFWGEIGAAMGYVAGEAVLFWLLYASFTKFHRFDLWPLLSRPLVASLLMAAALLPTLSYGLPVTIPFGALVFSGSLLAVRGLTKEDFTTIRTKLL